MMTICDTVGQAVAVCLSHIARLNTTKLESYSNRIRFASDNEADCEREIRFVGCSDQVVFSDLELENCFEDVSVLMHYTSHMMTNAVRTTKTCSP